ncbi:phage Gp37/Gp68 family protein [Hymenobacter sp. RP-2-7]|uniref:Phage Gp37/Gp68 family protein n=1 Tax=Hymenobacter polaris TaxID=2682546 RepID=A0A7Y0AHT0_9BACT|nr:phage Gp37/Gp68 family protein [Hymenobacter polaris]NML67628.1 phage Gp37/Gp68 family protein [Hymenobacter polaris]
MENTKIEWATHTFNCWEGCAKVSPGCKNCYANTQHQLHHSSLKSQQGTCWGVNAPRLGKSEENWKKPLKWNQQAQAVGVRARVFCASMADVFEPQSHLSAAYAGQTAEVPCGNGRTRTVRFVNLQTERLRLLRLILATPHLDWLLLTKRPEYIRPILQGLITSLALVNGLNGQPLDEWPAADRDLARWLMTWLQGTPPANVWLGTSVENQEQADTRIVALAGVPATVRFLSCEPLLEAVDLTRWANIFRIDWVIVGGESGPGARAVHPLWVESLRDQCQKAGVAFFFKQWGEYEHFCMTLATEPTGEPTKFFVFPDGYAMRRVGKHAAGRLLDGRTWDELPQRKEVAL